MKTWLHSVCIILHALNGTLTPVPTRTKETELEIVGAGECSIGSATHGPQALSGLSLRSFILSDRCEVSSMRWKSLLEWGQCQIKSNQWSNKVKGLWKIGLLSGLDTCLISGGNVPWVSGGVDTLWCTVNGERWKLSWRREDFDFLFLLEQLNMRLLDDTGIGSAPVERFVNGPSEQDEILSFGPHMQSKNCWL